MPMLYFASSEGRVGVYYTSLPNTGDPAYKPSPMPTPRRAAAAAPIGDYQAVVAGGLSANTGTVYSANELFAWTSWASRAAMPAPRHSHRAARLPDGRIAFIAGQSTEMHGSQTNTVYIYDPQTDTWSSGPTLPERKALMACDVLENGLVWVAGGSTNNSDRSKTTYLLNPSTMTWSVAASIPNDIGSAAGGALPGNRAGLPGGLGNSQTQANTALNTFYIYDPSSNTWSVGPAMPTPRSEHAVQWMGRELVVIGGWPSGLATTSNEAYDPFANVWIQNPTAPLEIVHAASTKLGGMMFTFSNLTSKDYVMAYWP